ncbi:MAG: thiamine pyrophosphate-dependent enzyme [Bacillota bacterium]
MIRTLYSRPQSLTPNRFHYCPGCSHGIVHRLVAEVVDELGLREKTIGVASVGCSVLLYNYLDIDMQEAAHGRAPAVATGIKRVLPDRVVFTYQGDGDLASIGLAEIVHAAARGENITVIFINNANYGMTGGQMAPTTLPGQKTTTSPLGRDVNATGYPLRMSELLATLDGPAYLARVAVTGPSEVVKTKKTIKKAFNCQIQGLGFSMVEVLSTCPTNWGMDPLAALEWAKDQMTAYYPPGIFRDKMDPELGIGN